MGLVIRLGRNEQGIWEGGVIPYTFGQNWSGREKETIMRGMKEWTDRTNCIKFLCGEWTNYVLINRETRHATCAKGRNTNGGMVRCDLNPSDLDRFYTVVLHELGHCIGLCHEQLRNDVPPDTENEILHGLAHGGGDIALQRYALASQKQRAVDNYRQVGNFDPDSVMLYLQDNDAVSDGDVAAVRDLYGQ